jgi:hypothetical protein
MQEALHARFIGGLAPLNRVIESSVGAVILQPAKCGDV